MKGSIKILLILGVISALLGAGMMTAGAMMGGVHGLGNLPYSWNRTFDSGRNRYEQRETRTRLSDEVEAETSGPAVSAAAGESYEYPGIRKLDIEVIGDSRIDIVTAGPDELPENTIRIVRSGSGPDVISYLINNNGTELTIHLPDHVLDINNIRDWQSFFDENHFDVEDLTIYVPENHQFHAIEVACIAGDLEADVINAEEMSIENISGMVVVQDGRIGALDIEVISGNTECYAIVGRDLDVECTSGDIAVMMAGGFESYDYKWTVLSGSITAGDQTLDGGRYGLGESEIDHRAGRRIEVDCISGSITINYENES